VSDATFSTVVKAGVKNVVENRGRARRFFTAGHGNDFSLRQQNVFSVKHLFLEVGLRELYW
jgi:hypothetical protein